jgi:hypothetical protein
MDNQYQTHVEPSNREVWYSSTISDVYSDRASNTVSRYRNKIRLTSYTGYTFLEFIKKSQLYLPVSAEDQYYFVDASKQYRPDLISNELYGSPIYYWVILSCNNLISPLQVRANLTLRIPPLASILNNGGLI